MTARGSRSQAKSKRRGRAQSGARLAEVFPEEVDPRGIHTLRVMMGTVEGVDGRDVFVDLGPRMQGVLPLERFTRAPRRGESFEFTLRGQEDDLWAVELAETQPMVSWETMELGSLVEARAIGANAGGLECKVGQLHGFMPRSECGIGRRTRPHALVGRRFWAEVIEVDRERQRVLLSRKRASQRRSESHQARGAQTLKLGAIVSGRVDRLLANGAAIRLDGGLRAFLHVSDIDHERVADPADRLDPEQRLELRVLAIRRGGRRISVGLKQVGPSPWTGLEARVNAGALLRGEVTCIREFGVFVRVSRGVVGLVRAAEANADPTRSLRHAYREGQSIVVRAVSLDVERERLELSTLHADGREIDPAEADLEVEDLRRLLPEPKLLETPLGAKLFAALIGRNG